MDARHRAGVKTTSGTKVQTGVRFGGSRVAITKLSQMPVSKTKGLGGKRRGNVRTGARQKPLVRNRVVTGKRTFGVKGGRVVKGTAFKTGKPGKPRAVGIK